MVIDEGYFRYGVTGEMASVIQEGAFYDLDGPVRRLGAMHVPIPFSPSLEDVTVPTERDVFELARIKELLAATDAALELKPLREAYHEAAEGFAALEHALQRGYVTLAD